MPGLSAMLRSRDYLCLAIGKGRGQTVMHSPLSSSPVKDHLKINTNKQNLQKELKENCNVLFMNRTLVKWKIKP
jgi:hypothetical protein